MNLRIRIFCLSTLLLAGTASAFAQAGYAVGIWATAPVAAPAKDIGQAPQTLRQFVHLSLGADHMLSVTFTNEFGTEPLTLGAASVALRSADGSTGTPVPLTFSQQATVVVPPGRALTSDMVLFTAPRGSDVAIDLFLPAQAITTMTQHGFANATNYSAPGNQVGAPALTGSQPFSAWRFIREVERDTTAAYSVICLGDSITDGSKSTKDTNQRWPDLLAARLGAMPKTSQIGVLNEGIGGNRILHDVTGPSALARFDRDVLNLGREKNSINGARYLIILEGINDIGHAYQPKNAYDVVNADELIAGYHLMIVRARANGLRVYGATLTPYMSAAYSSPAGEAVRQALNQWIRTTKELDGVIDFDKAARDPAHPDTFLPAYDSGDHLHPNDAGMHAMADSIDLGLFTK